MHQIIAVDKVHEFHIYFG